MEKVIVHFDLNAFFASAEELRHPELVGKPLAIGMDGRSGIISTCNYEARKYGVHSGQPTFQARQKCPQLHLLPADFEYYRVMSNSFFFLLKRVSSQMEMASIDEAYVDMTEVLRGKSAPLRYLAGLQARLKKETGLSCSMGVGSTKWLAKMGSDYKKPMGLTVIRKQDIPVLLYPLPIESFWGIGKKTSPRLRELGVSTIGDLARELEADNPLVLHCLGSFVATVKEWLQGKGDDKIVTEFEDPKSISSSETLMRDIVTLSEAGDTFSHLVHRVSLQAKRAHRVGWTISVVTKDSRFKTHQKSKTLENPTNDEFIVLNTARRLMEGLFEVPEYLPVRLIGVCLGRLVDPVHQTIQLSLWNYQEYEKLDKTQLLIADLNRKAKKKVFKRASEAKEKN